MDNSFLKLIIPLKRIDITFKKQKNYWAVQRLSSGQLEITCSAFGHASSPQWCQRGPEGDKLSLTMIIVTIMTVWWRKNWFSNLHICILNRKSNSNRKCNLSFWNSIIMRSRTWISPSFIVILCPVSAPPNLPSTTSDNRHMSTCRQLLIAENHTFYALGHCTGRQIYANTVCGIWEKF